MQNDASKAESAIQFCDYDDRETWITCGMALRDEFGETGFDIWDSWASMSEKYKPSVSKVTWKSFRKSGISIASLYKLAMEGGWSPTKTDHKPSAQEIAERQRRRQAEALKRDQEAQEAQQKAARKAGWIMSQAKPELHAYLHSKGFKEATGPVWWPTEDNNVLCLPMRYRGALCGVQMIGRSGQKRFLSGQRTSHAELTIDNDGYGGKHWWVEGYATGLSLREALKFLRLRYVIHVTFSAMNLRAMAHSGFVVADNDQSKTGEKVAIESGLPYFLPPEGDFNDLHKSIGTVRSALMLQKFIRENS